MKFEFSQLKAGLVGVLVLLTTSLAFATDGYFSHGYGIRYKALGGSGVSVFYSSLGAANNPAGLVFVGKRFDVELSFFVPIREFTVDGNPSGAPAFGLMPGTVESDNSFFVIPALGSNFMLNDKSSLGFSIYGNGGMNTEYPSPVFYGSSETTGVNLSQMFLNSTYSRKLGDNHALGVSFIVAFQWFEANGLEAFGPFSMDAANLSDNGLDNSFGYGFKFGYMGELAQGFRLGAAYQTKMKMGEFDDYSGLFAESGGFDIPSQWKVGLSYELTSDWMLALDVEQILYSEVNSIANPMANLFTDPPNPLGSDNGPGFGWEDMTIVKFGTEYSGLDTWKLRAGFSAGNQPIPESEMLFNILAPGVIENHLTFGFSKALNDKNEVSFALMHGFSKEVSGLNPLDPAQTIQLEMHQWEFSLGFNF